MQDNIVSPVGILSISKYPARRVFSPNHVRGMNQLYDSPVKRMHSQMVDDTARQAEKLDLLTVDEESWSHIGIPNIEDMRDLRLQIASLDRYVRDLIGANRAEFADRLSHIRNLFRIVSSDAGDPRVFSGVAPTDRKVKRLRKNWRKLEKLVMSTATLCDWFE